MKVAPAIVNVPLRLVTRLLGAALKLTPPIPAPLVPDVIVNHASLLTAVQPHPAAAETVMRPAPPSAVTDAFVDMIVGEQVLAAWLTVNVWPAIAIVPERAAPVFAAALKPTLPPPVPLAPDVTVTHPSLLAAVQEQALPVATVALPVPPATETDWLVGVSVYPHAA